MKEISKLYSHLLHIKRALLTNVIMIRCLFCLFWKVQTWLKFGEAYYMWTKSIWFQLIFKTIWACSLLYGLPQIFTVYLSFLSQRNFSMILISTNLYNLQFSSPCTLLPIIPICDKPTNQYSNYLTHMMYQFEKYFLFTSATSSISYKSLNPSQSFLIMPPHQSPFSLL